jgi:Fe2+ or Zn2+ uptake regulation protein
VTPTADAEERYMAALRGSGGRVTAPRRAVVMAFLASGGHVTAEDLAAAVQAEQPDVALSTVYRTMDALQRAGLVEQLHVGHGPAVYHLAEHHHRHLVCQACGRVIDVSEGDFDELVDLVATRFGFILDARHFALPGWCRSCAEA